MNDLTSEAQTIFKGAVYQRKKKRPVSELLTGGLGQSRQDDSVLDSNKENLVTTKLRNGDQHAALKKRQLKGRHQSLLGKPRAAAKQPQDVQTDAVRKGRPQHSQTQTIHDAQTRKPDLSCEASYFAELDDEELVEDTGLDEKQLQPSLDAPCSSSLECAQQSQEGQNVPSSSSSQSHAAMQTPDVAWLAAHHPALQAKYLEYVNCMGTKLTPMPLQDFCKLLGKDGRGTPVLHT